MREPDCAGLVHLSSGGVSIVLETSGAHLPAVLHWGSDLGPLSAGAVSQLRLASQAPLGDNRIDVPERVSVLPTPADGWVGRPGILGSIAGQAFSPQFRIIAEEPIESGRIVADGRRYRPLTTPPNWGSHLISS